MVSQGVGGEALGGWTGTLKKNRGISVATENKIVTLNNKYTPHYFLFGVTILYSVVTICYSVAPQGHLKTNSVGVIPLFGFTEACN